VIVDSRHVSAGGRYEPDICIIGAGAAGITLALELESTGRRIALIEAGGFKYDAASQRLFDGETAGDRYPPLRDTRLGALGGSTGVWAGYCRPLEESDFESRDGTVGWPFGRDTLDRYYRRAHEVCNLGACEYDEAHWVAQHGHHPLLPGDVGIRSPIFHLNPLRFGATYRRRLAASRNIELLLRSPVMRLHMSAAGNRVERVEVRTPGGRFDIRPRHAVLAAGGIENARLLLLSGDVNGEAPGDGRHLVGRYLTEHPFADPGYLVFSGGPRRLGYYFPQPSSTHRHAAFVRGTLSLRQQILEREQMQNGAILFYPRYESHDVYASVEVKEFLETVAKFRGKSVPGQAGRHLARALRAPGKIASALLRKLVVRGGPAQRWRLRAMFETESLYRNRVTLGTSRDEFDRPCARLEWQLSERDLRSMQHFMRQVDASFRRASIGHVELGFADNFDGWRAAVIGGKHHMGTTRMHRNPTQGVVDSNSRVHGTSNLYVAGSSVFPTCGFANPTLTIVALALRLGDHLRQHG
jgi:choline dehydrogenase-like flavoprotein